MYCLDLVCVCVLYVPKGIPIYVCAIIARQAKYSNYISRYMLINYLLVAQFLCVLPIIIIHAFSLHGPSEYICGFMDHYICILSLP